MVYPAPFPQAVNTRSGQHCRNGIPDVGYGLSHARHRGAETCPHRPGAGVSMALGLGPNLAPGTGCSTHCGGATADVFLLLRFFLTFRSRSGE